MTSGDVIPVGNRLVPTSELKHKGWHGWWALFLNSLRAWAEKRASYHAFCVLAYEQPLLVEQVAEHAVVQGRFRENRGTVVLAKTEISREEKAKNEQERALNRLAQLAAPTRARRYANGRRVFTMYEVDDETSPK